MSIAASLGNGGMGNHDGAGAAIGHANGTGILDQSHLDGHGHVPHLICEYEDTNLFGQSWFCLATFYPKCYLPQPQKKPPNPPPPMFTPLTVQFDSFHSARSHVKSTTEHVGPLSIISQSVSKHAHKRATFLTQAHSGLIV